MNALADDPGSGGADKAYRLLTGPDDAEFCRRVSDALEDGYVLYGSPTITFNGHNAVVAQAVVRPWVVEPR